MIQLKNSFKYSIVITIVLLAIGKLSAQGLTAVKDDSLRFEILLSNKMLNETHLDVKFIESLEVTSSRLIMLSSTNQFYLLGWGGIAPVGQKDANTISSFAYTPDGLLMIVRNNELCYIDSLGKFAKLYALPSQDMRITSGEKAIYLYDQSKDQIKHALYVLTKGGKYNELLTVPAPIKSVVEMNNSVLIATGNGLFCFDLTSKEMKALVALPNDKEIKSLAVDTLSNRIYFSTDSVVYALKDFRAVIITDKFSGFLRYFNGGLLVLNPEKKFLIRIVGLEGKIASIKLQMKTAANDKQILNALTNTSIIDMVKQKLSDGLIINIINRSSVDFNLSVDSMIYLSSQNVSSAVIMAMKNAMKRKTSNVSNDGNR